MQILVTGATGFVGSHATAELVRGGHAVRILARDPARVAPALGPHGVECEVFVGDMTDGQTVARAVEGCDAVVHAAAQIGVGGGGQAGDVNVEGVRTVVGAAIEAGVGRVVYTSSVTVHMPGVASRIALDTPLSEPSSPYAASKVAAERLVRTWQGQGHPITTVVLGGVYGPISRELTGSFGAILAAIETMMLVPPGGTTVIDVRDVARVLGAVVRSPRPPARVLAGGHFVTWDRWVLLLEGALGRPVVSQAMTAVGLRELARELTAAAAGSLEPPLLDVEAAEVMLGGVPVDDRESLAALGVEPTPLERTFGDTVAWLREIGRLPVA